MKGGVVKGFRRQVWAFLGLTVMCLVNIIFYILALSLGEESLFGLAGLGFMSGFAVFSAWMAIRSWKCLREVSKEAARGQEGWEKGCKHQDS